MTESIEHQNYVKKIVEYTCDLIPSEYIGMIRADLPEYEKPILSYNTYIPDVSFSYKGLLIIGEAKTYSDFKREHSMKQFDAYLEECRMHSGRSIIIIAVPWELAITAKNHFKLRKKKEIFNIEIVILSSNGRVERI